jgi:Immunity protein 8
VRAVLRELHSPDLPDLEHGAPPDPERFCILVQAFVGPADEEDVRESFDFLLCTPAWLVDELGGKPYVWGRHYLFVARYDFPAVMQAVTKICEDAEGPDWDAVAGILSRYGKWEFEDYQE